MPDVDTSLAIKLEIGIDVRYLEDLQLFAHTLLDIDEFSAFLAEELHTLPTRPEILSLEIHSFPCLKIKVSPAWLSILLSITSSYDKIPSNVAKMVHDSETVIEEVVQSAKQTAERVIPRAEWVVDEMTPYIRRTAEVILQGAEDDLTGAAKALRRAREALARDGAVKFISVTEGDADSK